MEPRKAILWHQGLFLQPQHFQQFDLYCQSLLSPLMNYLQPYFWGVCNIEIPYNSLKNMIFDIIKGEIVFQDGTWVDIPGNSTIQARSFVNEKFDAGKPYKVYVGLRKWNTNKENVTIIKTNDANDNVRTRFISYSDPAEIKDIHQGGQSAQLNLMEYSLKIFLENEIENLTDYCVVPVVELEYDGNELKIVRGFIPPVIALSGSEALRQNVQNIFEQLTSQCHKLEEYKISREIQDLDLNSQYLTSILALRTLSKYIPVLYHFNQTENIHPWNIYAILRQIVGELSTFTDRINSLGKLTDGTLLLPDYNHEKLNLCFSEVQTLIGELLSSIIIGPESIIQLIRKEGYFTASIPPEVFEERNSFFLVLKTAESQDKLLNAIQRIAKFSSIENISTLVGRALPGISLEYCLIPPPGLPSRSNSFYFKINKDHPQWIDVQKNQNICLYWEQAPKDTRAEIIILKK